MTKSERVIELVKLFDESDVTRETMISRQNRLKKLVDEHGVDCTALAGGYTINTLRQYLRVRWPFVIGEESVAKAEHILGQL